MESVYSRLLNKHMSQLTKKTYLLLIVAFAVLVIVVGYGAYFSSKAGGFKKADIVSSLSSPSPLVIDYMSTEGKNLKTEIIKTDKITGDYKTTETTQFKAEYLVGNKRFLVTIKKSPYSTSKKAAEDWFISQGFKGSDLCLPNISFVPAIGVNDKITTADAAFSGCPVSEK